jgi:hypothetical protein
MPATLPQVFRVAVSGQVRDGQGWQDGEPAFYSVVWRDQAVALRLHPGEAGSTNRVDTDSKRVSKVVHRSDAPWITNRNVQRAENDAASGCATSAADSPAMARPGLVTTPMTSIPSRSPSAIATPSATC